MLRGRVFALQLGPSAQSFHSLVPIQRWQPSVILAIWIKVVFLNTENAALKTPTRWYASFIVEWGIRCNNLFFTVEGLSQHVLTTGSLKFYLDSKALKLCRVYLLSSRANKTSQSFKLAKHFLLYSCISMVGLIVVPEQDPKVSDWFQVT